MSSGHRWGTDGMLAATTRALELADPGNAGTIKAKESPQVCHLESSGAETRTLADPDGPGQILILAMRADGGDITATASSAINQAGNTIMTFDDQGDSVLLYSIEDGDDNFEWRVAVADGVSLS